MSIIDITPRTVDKAPLCPVNIAILAAILIFSRPETVCPLAVIIAPSEVNKEESNPLSFSEIAVLTLRLALSLALVTSAREPAEADVANMTAESRRKERVRKIESL